jgi:hypothetical protein
MPILELSDAQVVELVKQLPPERQRAALLELAAGAAHRREEQMQYAEGQLQRVSAERGLEWDKMSDDQRQDFIDDLVHEDRRRESMSSQATAGTCCRWEPFRGSLF